MREFVLFDFEGPRSGASPMRSSAPATFPTALVLCIAYAGLQDLVFACLHAASGAGGCRDDDTNDVVVEDKCDIQTVPAAVDARAGALFGAR